MDFPFLIDQISKISSIQDIIIALDNEGAIDISIPSSSFFPILSKNILEEFDKQIILLASNSEQSEKYYDDLKSILNTDSKVKIFHQFNKEDLLSEEVGNVDAFDALRKNKKAIFIFEPASFLQEVSLKKELLDSYFELKINQEFDYDHLPALLYKFQYEKKDFVFEPGDFAIRGGIIDIFPYIGKHPYRIEFYGNSVESIREFDEGSQRSINNIDTVRITPNVFNTSEEFERIPISSFFNKDSIIIFDGYEIILKELKESDIFENKKEEILLSLSELHQIKNYVLKSDSEKLIDCNIISHPNYHSSLKVCFQDLNKLNLEEFEIFILCDGEKRLETIKNLFDDYQSTENNEILRINFVSESLQNGFIINKEKIAVLTEHEIFSRTKRRTIAKKRKIKGFNIGDLNSIHHGEYVVHIDYGVGLFDKLEKIKINGYDQESLKLKYLDGDSLYVNLNYINRIRKYTATEGVIPRLSKLGSGEWDRLKARTKKKLKDIARDLISLYAKRKTSEGFAFSKDNIWQKELEASFIFEDTIDQANATIAVKKDMESAGSMDRLVCGDVGYGKTEVAVRAAFKSVIDNKQVAILVPTTILAEQHYKTFSKRLANYPVTVESISRFKSSKQQKEIIEKLKNGKVDILIGTHRLLSKDIEFKDLGLLVIDEEQRFGVAAKEKLRKIKVNVDTLTLTATPIPRTLNFSLMGARDLSIIETPPKNRLPINTEIIKFEDNIIRNAILRELKRGGQVYFVNDKVNNLERLLNQLKDIVPEASFGIGHGQMPPHQLEKAMMDFMEKRIDVLVCTKIVESGLDISNVNTIFINHADRFGLAELYQLRGRVGRSNTQAYSYFIIPGFEILSTKAIKRLSAIEEFTELSSGFKLAMRDMEIRGIGNLLGAEQSGFVDSMGFEIYTKVLDEAVEELKEEEFKELFDKAKFQPKKVETIVEIDRDTYFPEYYIQSNSERFLYYQKLYDAEDESAIFSIKDEIIDKYGKIAEEGENLIKLVILRLLLSRLRANKFSIKGDNIIIYFKKENFQDEASFEIINKIIEYLQNIKKITFYVKDLKDEVTINISLEKIEFDYLEWTQFIFEDILKKE